MVRWALLGSAAVGLAACAPGGVVARAPALPAATLFRIPADPTAKGPRLVPEALDAGTSFGAEPGGGTRFIAGGVRALRLPSGAVQTSEERFSSLPKVFALPPRLGGGTLFVVGTALLWSETWLGKTRAIYANAGEIADVWTGLDRVYVRAKNGTYVALDPRKGVVDLGPWPNVPAVASYRALDGWRAAAIGDLRGVVASFDAGASWRAIDLPLEPARIGAARVDALSGEVFEVAAGAGGAADFLFVQAGSPGAASSCFALAQGKPPTRLTGCPGAGPAGPGSGEASAAGALPAVSSGAGDDAAAGKVFGPSPLLAAVEDGFPLGDGTAIVARDGALGRVRLSDGFWVAVRSDAFRAHPSRCHALPVSADDGTPALGFACAEPSGGTALYAADVGRLALIELRRWPEPRGVLAFGNGAIAVRGPCGSGGLRGDGRYCVLSGGHGRPPRWDEVHAPEDAPDARILVPAEGEPTFLVAPGGVPDEARLARRAGKPAVKLALPGGPREVRHALDTGIWLDGFEERAPGVFGGWVDAAGAMLGVEVSLDGTVRAGTFVRDAGAPMVSGRYGLGWAASRRGYETTDGGMTWTAFTVPDALAVPRERACGPVGCTAAGWIRVGWGPEGARFPETYPARPPPYRPRPADLVLECDDAGRTAGGSGALPRSPSEGAGFYGLPAPPSRSDDQVVTADAASTLERGARIGSLARVFAWGPRSEDWAHVGRWSVQWLWPYGGPADARTTAPALAPFTTLDAARRAIVGAGPLNLSWSLAPGDDARNALVLARRFGAAPEITAMFAIEADRSPAPVARADGEPFTELDSAVRLGVSWYLVGPQASGEPRASVVYRVDADGARELARVPRTSADGRTPSAPKLARRSDGRAVGVVVDGPDGARWVLPIDVETGQRGEPEPLGAADLSDRASIAPCGEDEEGWVFDTQWNGASWSARARVEVGKGRVFGLGHLFVRVRQAQHRACLERISGTYDSDARDEVAVAPRRPVETVGAIHTLDRRALPALPVSVLWGHGRHALRCRTK